MKKENEKQAPSSPSSSEEKPTPDTEPISASEKYSGIAKKYVEKLTPSLSQFLKVLFDFSFQEFITIRLIKLIYVVGILIGLGLTLFGIVEAFEESFLIGILILIISPIAFLINVILLRVILELIIVLFHIGENLEEMSRKS